MLLLCAPKVVEGRKIVRGCMMDMYPPFQAFQMCVDMGHAAVQPISVYLVGHAVFIEGRVEVEAVPWEGGRLCLRGSEQIIQRCA